MGSLTELPDAGSPDLRLVFPTEDEKLQTWTMNHVEWGGALSLEDYLVREPYLATIPMAENGGMRYWILTDSTPAGGKRPVLASVETLRKKVFVLDPKTGEVREDILYGIASVYTNPQYRGRRYASRMLEELDRTLEKGFEDIDGKFVKPAASALWSDIGKSFYAKLGWVPYPSLHVSFRVPETVADTTSSTLDLITYENLESFCRSDEQLLRKHLLRCAQGGRPQFAFVPNYDIIRWHLYRDEFIANRVFKDKEQTPIKGVVAGLEGKRVWAIWTRNYGSISDDPEKNTMYILRLVVEDESASQEELSSTFGAVMHKAQTEARRWRLGKIELWNPTPTIDALIRKSGLEHDVIERQKDSIPSLRWHGEHDTEQVDWVANEKFCWC